jgi:hypothetical protein
MGVSLVVIKLAALCVVRPYDAVAAMPCAMLLPEDCLAPNTCAQPFSNKYTAMCRCKPRRSSSWVRSWQLPLPVAMLRLRHWPRVR